MSDQATILTPAKPSFWSRLPEFFEEDNGGLSNTRLLTTFIVVAPVLMWMVLCLYHMAIVAYDNSVLGLQLGSLGLKGYQKSSEQKVS